MIIGIPKEIKEEEYRVGILPKTIRQLVKKGHRISMSIRPAGGSVIYLKPSHQKHYEPKNQ